jgi:hypothetical protein
VRFTKKLSVVSDQLSEIRIQSSVSHVSREVPGHLAWFVASGAFHG